MSKGAFVVILLAAGLAMAAAQQGVAAGWPDPQGDGGDMKQPAAAQQANGTAAKKEVGSAPAGDSQAVQSNKTDAVAGAPPVATPKEEGSATTAAVAPAGTAAGEAAATEEKDVDTEEELKSAVKSAPEGKFRKVINKLIRKEAPAELANHGLGDISPAGACKDEIARFCKKKQPGGKRLAKCLWDHLEEEGDDDEGDDDDDKKGLSQFSHECRSELDTFEQDAAGNVNKNVPLAIACKEDIEAFCEGVDSSEPGTVLACLRQNRSKLKHECKKQVFVAMVMAAQDLRVDVIAWKACSADAKRLCANVKFHRGRIQDCLRNHTGSLSWECKGQLFRREVQSDGDIRLSVRLLKKCMADKKRFCADVEPRESQVKDCLEDHIMEEDLSDECTRELADMIEARSANFRLDSKIREYCAADVERMCGVSNATMQSDNLTEHEDSIGKCLQDYRKEIRNPACATRVNRMITLSMADIRFNHPLAEACAADRASLCGSIPPGSARVIRCLKEKRAQLSETCAAMLFDQEQVMAENIDFQFPLKRACTAEIVKYCGAVPHGRGRVLRCLEHHVDQEQEFSKKCKEEIQKHEELAAEDYRLNTRLKEACAQPIVTLCHDACGSLTKKGVCGGMVLKCLTESYDSIEGEDCKTEVFYFMKMEVRDFRSDVFLAEACHDDVEEYCKEHIATGHDRVVQCLHDNRDRLSQACRSEEIKLDVMRSSNIDLRPGIAQACAEERQQHCADVRPGKARVLDCLLAKADKVDFSEQCREVLGTMQARRLEDWRRDYDMRTACKDDVSQACAEEAGNAENQDGAVFRCLLGSMDVISRSCQEAVGGAASGALQFYRPSLPGVEACDEDVQRVCSVNGEVSQVVGQVKACLGVRLAHDRAVLANRTIPAQLLPSVLPPRPKQPADGAGEQEPGPGRRMTAEALPGRMPVRRQRREPILSEACRNLLDVASPEDSLAELQTGLATNAVLSQLADVEKALGLEEGTLHNQGESGAKVLTLTGWVAVLCMFGLATATIGGGIYLVRRFTGPSREYTMVLKHAPPSEA